VHSSCAVDEHYNGWSSLNGFACCRIRGTVGSQRLRVSEPRFDHGKEGM